MHIPQKLNKQLPPVFSLVNGNNSRYLMPSVLSTILGESFQFSYHFNAMNEHKHMHTSR